MRCPTSCLLGVGPAPIDAVVLTIITLITVITPIILIVRSTARDWAAGLSMRAGDPKLILLVLTRGLKGLFTHLGIRRGMGKDPQDWRNVHIQ